MENPPNQVLRQRNRKTNSSGQKSFLVKYEENKARKMQDAKTAVAPSPKNPDRVEVSHQAPSRPSYCDMLRGRVSTTSVAASNPSTASDAKKNAETTGQKRKLSTTPRQQRSSYASAVSASIASPHTKENVGQCHMPHPPKRSPVKETAPSLNSSFSSIRSAMSKSSRTSTTASSRRETRSSLKPADGHSRPYHANADPSISIRQVEERLKMNDMKDWCNMSDLEDREEADLARYKSKLARRAKEKGEQPPKIEEDLELLSKRQRTLDKVKVTETYKQYLFQLPKDRRTRKMPVTPNKFRVLSRRDWETRIERWKRHLHHWNEPQYEPSVCSNISRNSSRLSVTSCSDTSIVSEEDVSLTPNKGPSVAMYEESNTMTGAVEQTTTATAMFAYRDVQDDSTLQAPLASSPKKGGITSSLTVSSVTSFPLLEDDEAANTGFGAASMEVCTVVGTRTVTRMGSTVEPDILHSGLTNEMRQVANWSKRPFEANEDTSAHSSPKKKARRAHV